MKHSLRAILLPSVPEEREEGDRLHRLPEAHLVGEHAVHARFPQQAHPVYPDQLIPDGNKERVREMAWHLAFERENASWTNKETLFFFAKFVSCAPICMPDGDEDRALERALGSPSYSHTVVGQTAIASSDMV